MIDERLKTAFKQLIITPRAWARIEPLLSSSYPPAHIGRPHIDFRRAIGGILFLIKSGCRWCDIPLRFGDWRSLNRWFLRWANDGVIDFIWGVITEGHEALETLDWKVLCRSGLPRSSRITQARKSMIADPCQVIWRNMALNMHAADAGNYLVRPSIDVFDSGSRPENLDRFFSDQG